jgi:hypothetical protein
MFKRNKYWFDGGVHIYKFKEIQIVEVKIKGRYYDSQNLINYKFFKNIFLVHLKLQLCAISNPIKLVKAAHIQEKVLEALGTF